MSERPSSKAQREQSLIPTYYAADLAAAHFLSIIDRLQVQRAQVRDNLQQPAFYN